MNKNIETLIEQFIPYLLIGMAVALFVGLFMLFSHLLLWGLIIGVGLWAAMWIKEYCFPSHSAKNNKGRIIEHDDTKP